MKRFYIEFECSGVDKNYVMQSKWFDSESDAVKWYMDNFDYVDSDEMSVCLMCADYDLITDEYGDITFVRNITTLTRYLAKEKINNDN